MTTMTMPKTHGDRPIEGMMAKWYANNTGEMMNEFTELAQRVAGRLAPGAAVLEVAPGPGYFCMELAKLGSYEITGLDLSKSFVKMATEKATAEGLKVKFVRGSASKMPLMRNSYDFLLCRAAFKNFADPVGALQEMCRVLKPGGQGLLIDLKGNASPDAVSRMVDAMKLTRFNGLLTKLAFQFMLVKTAYTRKQFEQMLAQSGFSSVDIVESEIGFEISMTK
jgi:ubiquinone/menaquinone biosynthesis C-methylase UbiE